MSVKEEFGLRLDSSFLAMRRGHTYPPAKLRVGLLAIAIGTFTGDKQAGFERTSDGCFGGGNAGPAEETIGPVREPVRQV